MYTPPFCLQETWSRKTASSGDRLCRTRLKLGSGGFGWHRKTIAKTKLPAPWILRQATSCWSKVRECGGSLPIVPSIQNDYSSSFRKRFSSFSSFRKRETPTLRLKKVHSLHSLAGTPKHSTIFLSRYCRGCRNDPHQPRRRCRITKTVRQHPKW